MNEILRRTEEKCRRLTTALEPTFGNREDAALAASMLVSWLQAGEKKPQRYIEMMISSCGTDPNG